MKEDKGHQEHPRSRVPNKKYRDNWERIYGKKKQEEKKS